MAPYFICHEQGKGVIARYNSDTAEIEAQLAALRASGADGISLSPWLMPGADNQLFLDWSSGQLAAQNQSNLLALISSIKMHGFNWIQVAPQFYGVANDFRQWMQWDEARYLENRKFIFSLSDWLLASGLPYLIDACAEVNAGDGSQYAKRLWTDITSWFYPDGAPCWNFSMSFLPDAASIAGLPSLFRGLDQGGPVNAPVFLVPHIYRNEQQACYDALQASPAWDLHTRPWIIGECFSLTEPSDVAVAQGWRDFVVSTKQLIYRVCPWPQDPRTPPENKTAVLVIPQNGGAGWAECGF